MSRLRQILDDLGVLRRMPTISIDLMHSRTAGNDPFYDRVVSDFCRSVNRRHRKLPFIRAYEFGVSVCEMPETFDEYFMMIEAAGRRNYKKAKRLGYSFGRMDYNEHLEDIQAIRESTDYRQGPIEGSALGGKVRPCEDPPSRTDIHDYPYFGVHNSDGVVMAYAGCLVSGEACMIEHIFGHADRHADGVVPMLIVGIADYILNNYPNVKYYTYSTYFGAGTSLRRFKRKFKFLPHRVKWAVG